jgi:Tfp pilus assembly protein PilF
VVDPDYEEAHYNVGCLHRREGDRTAAVARFRRAVELDPDYAVAHAALGEELFAAEPLANRAEAVAHLSRAVALDPADGWSHARLAIARDLDGRDDEARANHEAAIRLLPDVGAVWSNYGAFLSSRGDAAAERILRHGIAVDAEDGAPRAWLALHLWRVDRRAEARMEMQAAHQLGHAKAMNWLDVWRSEPTD